MTSRQPEAKLTGSMLRRDPLRRVLALMVPLVPLVLLGLACLRGVLTPPSWNGPLQRDRLLIGLALEGVLVVLFLITIRRQRAAIWLANLRALGQQTPARQTLRQRAALAIGVTTTEMAGKLRAVLLFVLGGGIAAAAVTMLANLNAPRGKHVKLSPPGLQWTRRGGKKSHHPVASHFPWAPLLYGALVVLLIAAILLSIWWARRLSASAAAEADGFIAADPEDPESLRDAVASGRSALGALDDARAAIIACYLAMEASLAQRGTTRGVAGTPDELLARATAQGVVRGTAAARLTALFYEARFSSHPLDPSQRDAAGQALDELAAALDGAPEPAGSAPARGAESTS